MGRTQTTRWSRRQFLRHSVASAGVVATAPLIVPASTLGGTDRAPANDRVVMGAIGIGGRGGYVMRAFMEQPDVQMVAVCDVHGERRAQAKEAVDKHYGNHDCQAYVDLRELLARSDLDAVMIATGDNWHSAASILAAKAGKDVYCEKPMSLTIAESRAVVETMRRFARIYQCGTQRRNIGNFGFAVNLARSGKLGRLRELQAEKAGQNSGVSFQVLPAQPEPARDVFAWDLWLGPAAWRPYNDQYPTRGFWAGHGDFSGGPITEWGSHTVDLCQWANAADDTSPVEYEIMNEHGDVLGHYANGVRLVIRSGLRHGTCPVRFEGEDGWVETGDSGHLEAHPKSLLEDRKFKGGYPAEDHVREFLNCVGTRQQPASNAAVAHRSITACHAANVAVRLGRSVRWDPVKEEFVDDEQANRLRSRAYRQPWRL